MVNELSGICKLSGITIGETSDKEKTNIHDLNFKFVEDCSDLQKLREILNYLREEEQGSYVKLEEAVLKRISKVRGPENKVVRASAAFEEISSFVESFDSTIDTGTSIDGDYEIIEYPVRKAYEFKLVEKESTNSAEKKISEERLQSTDYRGWEKFDADKEILDIEVKEAEFRVRSETFQLKEHNEHANRESSTLADIKKQISDLRLTHSIETYPRVASTRASRLKTMGNECVRARDFNEALSYYKAAMLWVLSVENPELQDEYLKQQILSNQALVYNRTKEFSKAINCASVALKSSKGEHKELHGKILYRRSTAYLATSNYIGALSDLEESLNYLENSKPILQKMIRIREQMHENGISKGEKPAVKLEVKDACKIRKDSSGEVKISEKVKEALQNARRAEAQGDIAKAIGIYGKVYSSETLSNTQAQRVKSRIDDLLSEKTTEDNFLETRTFLNPTEIETVISTLKIPSSWFEFRKYIEEFDFQYDKKTSDSLKKGFLLKTCSSFSYLASKEFTEDEIVYLLEILLKFSNLRGWVKVNEQTIVDGFNAFVECPRFQVVIQFLEGATKTRLCTLFSLFEGISQEKLYSAYALSP